ncbi:MAG: glycosyltransferase family 4 protein [Chrysiogenia bacterium]
MIVKKVLLVTNIPNPYRIPLFNELKFQLNALNIEFKVIFGIEGYSRRKFVIDLSECEFEYEILKSSKINIKKNKKPIFTYSKLVKQIREERPDVIVTTGYSISTIKVYLLSLIKKINYIIWSGSILKKDRNDSFARIILRKLLIKRASGFLAYGTKAKEYFELLGAPSNKIYMAINTVDTSFYEFETNKIRIKNERSDTKKHLTYIGYLVPIKNVKRILEIVCLLKAKRNDFELDIIGDGDDLKNLLDFVDHNKLHEFVHFHGFKQKKELPFYLSNCDCFLFQTEFDIWGLVLNEAMAAGVPCLASKNAGATFDLIKHGLNGFVVDFEKQKEVVEIICHLFDDPDAAKKIGFAAREFIQENATLRKSVQGFLDCILSL